MPSGSCLYRFRAWSSVQSTVHGPVFVPCRLVKHAVPCRSMAHQADNNLFSSIFSPNAETFHHFHELFIIFISIPINNIYTSHNYTNNSFLLGRYRVNRWNGLCPCHATCLGGGPNTVWSLKPSQIVGPWVELPGHGLHVQHINCSSAQKRWTPDATHRSWLKRSIVNGSKALFT